jgi:phosphonate transport system substrate-binding protein
MLRAGAIDVAAIDSSVLELETLADPAIAEQLRVIASLGPSPAPPWVAHRSVPRHVREAVRQAMVAMRADPAALTLLRDVRMTGFAEVADADYDPIREMERIAAPVKFSLV